MEERVIVMTEKRFKLREPNGAYLIDGDKPLFHLDDSDDKIVELLNSLNDENEQLKKKVESKERLIKSYEQFINDLKEDGVLDD